jgi:hypothetical protein
MRRQTKLRIDEFEDRLVPAVAIDSAYETYAWVLINSLRQNPTAFANNIQGLVNGSLGSAFGFAKTDPVIVDLKEMINAGSQANYTASLNLMKATPAAGPLAWEELLEDRAGSHNEWMKVNGFAHTGTTGNRTAIPGFSSNNNAPTDTWGYPPGTYSSFGENIGWAAGSLSHTKDGYNTGAYGLAGLQQRAAFLDTVAYMLELNSATLGHLKNLLGRDSGSGGTLPSFNAIGTDTDLFEAPAAYEAQDGVPEAYLSTHRLGLYRPNGTGGFVTGIVYDDANHNGFYDAGEGASVTVNVRDANGNGFTDTLTAGNHHGAFAGYVANGTYMVTVSANGQTVGTRSVTVNNSNAWAGLSLGDGFDGKPDLTGPTGSQTTLRPTVTWNAVAGAGGYQVRVDDLSALRTNIFANAPASGTSWSPPADLVSGRSYRVWVRATFGSGPGPWSDPSSFSIAKPAPSAPTGAVANLRPSFSWSAIAGATAYEVRVRDVSANRFNIFPGVRVTGTSWTPPADLVSGRKYSFTVRAVNASNLGVWSTAAAFSIARPTPSGPVGDVNNVRPTFNWSAVTGVASYQVRVVDLTTGRRVYLESVSATNWSPSSDLVVGHRYRWWVRAVNAAGLGAWSVLTDFRVV